ncbi:unnamed protein product [Nippostrongylus brasiliensis]|uniref:PITH domain-containing protein n=1 Tax=Nippostrongylus brasiliensis TaxID=27835 RepID=A0A0N4YBV7_NIPBR|nr:unnamed protein product [Nippostrongylus brasiliensis]
MADDIPDSLEAINLKMNATTDEVSLGLNFVFVSLPSCMFSLKCDSNLDIIKCSREVHLANFTLEKAN